jgi:hypothetical protein
MMIYIDLNIDLDIDKGLTGIHNLEYIFKEQLNDHIRVYYRHFSDLEGYRPVADKG